MSECAYCAGSAWRTGTKSRTILDVDDQGNPQNQVIRVQRWQCKQCLSFFTTGANVSGSKAITSPKAREQIAGYERTLITNFEKQTVVDILKGTDRALLLEWFASKGRDAIDHAVVSVHIPYKQAVLEHSPAAHICVLHNHIAARANHVFLNSLRTRRRILGAGSYRNVREAARIFATRNVDLTGFQKEDMQAWDSSIQSLYNAKEDFMIALERSDANLLKRVKACCLAIPSQSSSEFIEVWKSEIISLPQYEPWFETALVDINTAFTKSKLIQSFDLLRAHTLLNREQLISYQNNMERPVYQGVLITDVLENLEKSVEP